MMKFTLSFAMTQAPYVDIWSYAKGSSAPLCMTRPKFCILQGNLRAISLTHAADE